MAERRIWPTNNLVDLKQVADAFGLPDELVQGKNATQSVGDILGEILLELRRLRVGMSTLVDMDLEEIGDNDF